MKAEEFIEKNRFAFSDKGALIVYNSDALQAIKLAKYDILKELIEEIEKDLNSPMPDDFYHAGVCTGLEMAIKTLKSKLDEKPE